LTDPGLVQGLSRVVAAINWDEVKRSERNAWLSALTDAFGSGTDTHLVAAQAILMLATSDHDAVESFVQDRFATEPSLEALALVVDTSTKLPPELRQVGWSLVAEALARVREQSHAGSYGMGSFDVGDLATAVALAQRADEVAWSQLVDFLIDPATSTTTKQLAFDRISRARPKPPASARGRLRDELAELQGAQLDFGTAPEGFVAAKLRLASSIGGLAPDQMLSELLALAGSRNPFGLHRGGKGVAVLDTPAERARSEDGRSDALT
jgi:hypothetical protein